MLDLSQPGKVIGGFAFLGDLLFAYILYAQEESNLILNMYILRTIQYLYHFADDVCDDDYDVNHGLKAVP